MATPNTTAMTARNSRMKVTASEGCFCQVERNRCCQGAFEAPLGGSVGGGGTGLLGAAAVVGRCCADACTQRDRIEEVGRMCHTPVVAMLVVVPGMQAH